MKNKFFLNCTAVFMAATIAFAPVNASAATLLRKGSSGSQVVAVQTSLKDLGYYTYSKLTGYYGSVTVAAVKRFQKANGLYADGIVGTKTRNLLKASAAEKLSSAVSLTSLSLADTAAPETADSSATVSEEAVSGSAVAITTLETKAKITGALDWYTQVQYIFDRGDTAVVTDIETGKSFTVERTYGTNHADVEPLTKEDTNTIREIWGGFNWQRRAVTVEIGDYLIAASMTGMPHAGVESAPANRYVSGRSDGYGRGVNLDAIKGNGCSGVLDIHFKNSRTHTTNVVQKSQQDMVMKAADFIKEMNL